MYKGGGAAHGRASSPSEPWSQNNKSCRIGLRKHSHCDSIRTRHHHVHNIKHGLRQTYALSEDQASKRVDGQANGRVVRQMGRLGLAKYMKADKRIVHAGTRVRGTRQPSCTLLPSMLFPSSGYAQKMLTAGDITSPASVTGN